MDKVQRMKQQKQYEDYVKKKTPRHNVWFNMLKAFLLGGTICFLGQVIYHYCEMQKLSADACSSWTSLLLVLISVLLTGTGISASAARSSPSPVPSSCTESSQAGRWACSTGCGHY